MFDVLTYQQHYNKLIVFDRTQKLIKTSALKTSKIKLNRYVNTPCAAYHLHTFARAYTVLIRYGKICSKFIAHKILIESKATVHVVQINIMNLIKTLQYLYPKNR